MVILAAVFSALWRSFLELKSPVGDFANFCHSRLGLRFAKSSPDFLESLRKYDLEYLTHVDPFFGLCLTKILRYKGNNTIHISQNCVHISQSGVYISLNCVHISLNRIHISLNRVHIHRTAYICPRISLFLFYSLVGYWCICSLTHTFFLSVCILCQFSLDC